MGEMSIPVEVHVLRCIHSPCSYLNKSISNNLILDLTKLKTRFLLDWNHEWRRTCITCTFTCIHIICYIYFTCRDGPEENLYGGFIHHTSTKLHLRIFPFKRCPTNKTTSITGMHHQGSPQWFCSSLQPAWYCNGYSNYNGSSTTRQEFFVGSAPAVYEMKPVW